MIILSSNEPFEKRPVMIILFSNEPFEKRHDSDLYSDDDCGSHLFGNGLYMCIYTCTVCSREEDIRVYSLWRGLLAGVDVVVTCVRVVNRLILKVGLTHS